MISAALLLAKRMANYIKRVVYYDNNYVVNPAHVIAVPMNTPSLLPCIPRDLRAKPSPEHDDDNADVMESPAVGGEVASGSEPSEPTSDSKTDNQTLLRLLEEGDKVKDAPLIRR